MGIRLFIDCMVSLFFIEHVYKNLVKTRYNGADHENLTILTRAEQLAFCKVCTNRRNDLERGIVCGLTDLRADFNLTCDTFQKDEALHTRLLQRNAADALDGKLATQGQRLANYLIDYLFLIGFGAIIGAVLGVLLSYLAPQHLYVLEQDNRILDYVFGLVIGIIYYSFFEGFTGRSIGKFFTKTKVVTEDGERPDFGTIVIRSFCRYIPFNHFSFLGNSNEPGWHDRFSKTRVIEID